MTFSREPARSRDELSKSGCYKCGSAEHFHKDRHSGWVCPGKSIRSSSQKNSNSAVKAVPQPARSFADAVAQRSPSQDVATAGKIPVCVGCNSHSENCSLILHILQEVLVLLSAGSGCKCSSLATEEPYKAVLDERLPLSAAHSIVDSLAALTVQKSVSGEPDNGAASVVPKEAKAAAPLPKNNRSGSASPTNIVAPKSAKVPALIQADSKTPSSTTASVAPKTEAGVASLPKIESKRSAADISDKAKQQRLPSSSDPKVASAASASSSVDRQEEHKGAVSDTLLQHFKRADVELDLLANEVFMSKDLDGSDLPDMLRRFHTDNVFIHELVKIAFTDKTQL